MRELSRESVSDIAVGSAVLGTGGGGDPSLGQWMAIHAIEEYGPVRLITVDELDRDSLVVPAGMMGAPTVLVEKIPGGQELVNAYQRMETLLGKTIEAIMPVEAGGVNSLLPLVLAAQKGIPVVDADSMGRAFPEVHMTVFHLNGLSPEPAVLADEKGNTAVLYPADGDWYEGLARELTVRMGGSVAVLDYPLRGEQVKQSAIPGTLSLAERVGSMLRQFHSRENSPVQSMIEQLEAVLLFQGKVVDVERRTESGFAKGKVCLTGTGSYRERECELLFQNEFLAAQGEGKVIATTPDLICVLDEETGTPVTTEKIRYGMRTVVIGLPCHPKWRTVDGLNLVGPRRFGYPFDYVPIPKTIQGSV